MDLETFMKIKENKKYYEYLHTHSYWYRSLNRNKDNYNLFLQSAKKELRENKFNKFEETIDNIDMLSTILKLDK